MSESTNPQLRPEMAKLPTYKAGKKVEPVNGLTAYKLSSNEIAHSPLPSVLAAIVDAAAEINRYPDPFTTKLINALSEKFSVPVDQIATGTGSVGVCQQIIQSVAGAGDEVIYAWRSFEAYPIITTIAGAVSVQVPLTDDGQHDLAAMLNAITPKTRAIFVCTPNNPTGGIVTQQQINEFLAKVPKNILVVIDEAYVEFNRDENAIDGIATMKATLMLEYFGLFLKHMDLLDCVLDILLVQKILQMQFEKQQSRLEFQTLRKLQLLHR